MQFESVHVYTSFPAYTPPKKAPRFTIPKKALRFTMPKYTLPTMPTMPTLSTPDIVRRAAGDLSLLGEITVFKVQATYRGLQRTYFPTPVKRHTRVFDKRTQQLLAPLYELYED